MNVFKLFASLFIDTSDYEQGLNSAEQKTESFGSKMASGLGTAVSVVTTATATAITATAGVVAALTKQAVSAYGDYEQLSGGVETMFKDSSGAVMDYAKKAYKSAGLSANQYMETVTGFSAALIHSLEGDTAASAEVANMAVVDMSDNANKMGTDISSIQSAYQGFAKQNYTMLDNLKLGYGGTKEEMERLIEDANALKEANGELGDLSIESFADIVEAIHLVQTEMGITGTTQAEATETIQGSLNMLSGAWTNLVADLGNANADLDEDVSLLVESAETALGNLLPIVETALTGIASAIEKLAPVIAEKLPGLIKDMAPKLIGAASTVLISIATALPDLITVIVNEIPGLIKTVIDLTVKLLPQLIDVAFTAIFTLADGLIEALPEIIPAIVRMVLTIVEKLTDPDTVGKLIQAAFGIMGAIVSGIIQALPVLIEMVPQIIANLVLEFGKLGLDLWKAGKDLMAQLGKGIEGYAQNIGPAMEAVWTALKKKVDGWWQTVKGWGKDLLDNFIQGIKDNIEKFKKDIGNVAQSIKDLLGFSEPKEGPLSNFHTYAPDMMQLFAEGVRENEDLITDQLEKSFNFKPVISQATQEGSTGVLGGSTAASDNQPIQITVQSILDGKKVGESAYTYSRAQRRIYGR